jgi:hypothetical protein
MRSLIFNPVLGQDDDPFRALDGGKPVRDHDRRAVFCKAFQRGLNRAFAFGFFRCLSRSPQNASP